MSTTITTPTPELVEWADCELGALIHFDLPVFTENPDAFDFRKEEPLPASIFNPARLDTDQWIAAAAAMGAKYAVLVAKHCTGFCLWPTEAHGYSVKSSPYKDGKGDIVGEFFASCRKYGLRPGLYYSASCNQYMNVLDSPGRVRGGDPEAQKAYNEMVIQQLTEIWTRYGELFEIWFDGGCLPVEEGGPDIAGLLHKLQPNAVVFQGPAGTRSLLRWVGNERGIADPECSACVDFMAQDCDGTVEMRSKGDTFGNTWCPAESDLPNRDARTSACGGWFWKKGEESSVKSAEHLFDTYLKSVGRGTNMLVGMVIDTDGRFPETDEAQFRRFAELRRKAFGECRADSGWMENAGSKEIRLKGKNIRYAVLSEKIAMGERVLGYEIKGLRENGSAASNHTGEIIGHKRILEVPEEAMSEITEFILNVTAEKAPAVLRVQLY